MTMTAASATRPAASPWGSGAQRRRALVLLGAGMATTHAVAALCLLVFGLLRGRAGLVSALLAAAVVLLCFGLAQGVQVLVANASPTTVLVAAMASYLIPFVGLGLAMYYAAPHLDAGALDTLSLMVTLVACVLAWTGALIVAFTRLRFPVYDTEYQAPGKAGVAA